MMSTLETGLKCSGMCTKYDYYIFSDVNSTKTIKGSCKKEMEKLIKVHGRTIYIVLIIICLYMIINIIAIGV